MYSTLTSTPPKHVLTAKAAEERLKPHKARLETCIQHGWNAWSQDYAHKHHILRARSRATIVFDEIVAKAMLEFDGLEGVNFRLKGNSFLLFIGNDIILRFKKIGRKGQCSNVQTRQQFLFQTQQMVFENMQPATLLHAGYALDSPQLNILRKLVVCQCDNEILWTMELVAETPVLAMPKTQKPKPITARPRFIATDKQKKEEPKERKKAKGA
jgi:hypothetical protein